MNLTDTLDRCPNCNSYFYNKLPTRAVLHANLMSNETIYTYCKESCLIKKLENMNAGVPEFFRIKIKSQNRIPATAEEPVIYRIDFEREEIHVK